MNMSEITPAVAKLFCFENARIRTVEDDAGNTHFVAKDIALALDYTWNGAGTVAHVPESWRPLLAVETPSAVQYMVTLSESGLRFFLKRSDKPKARPFQKWFASMGFESAPELNAPPTNTPLPVDRYFLPPSGRTGVSDTQTKMQHRHDVSKVSVIPFAFDGASIRVVCDESGEPWIVAKDVAASIGCTWKGFDSVRHVPARWRREHSFYTTTGDKELITLSEQGLYFFLARSDKPKAQPFQEWLAGEVLPSIRKHGAYAASDAHASVQSAAVSLASELVVHLRFANELVSSVPGVDPAIAAAATLHCLQESTGLALEPLRKALPTHGGALSAMNATHIGEKVGLSAREVNSRLQSMGFQFKNDRKEWELTDAGRAHGEALPYSNGKHSGYQVLWRDSVIDMFHTATAAA